MLLQLPGACAASSELLSSLLLPRLGEGAGLDPLSQPDSLPKGWSHFPRGYKCKRSGECNPSSNHGMQRKQEPWGGLVKAACARTLLTVSWGPAPFPAGLDQSGFAKELTYGDKIPISVSMPLPLPQATPCQLPVSKRCQWLRLPYFVLSLHWCVCVWAVGAALLGLVESGFSWQPAARYCQVQSSCRREKDAEPGTEIKGARD